MMDDTEVEAILKSFGKAMGEAVKEGTLPFAFSMRIASLLSVLQYFNNELETVRYRLRSLDNYEDD